MVHVRLTHEDINSGNPVRVLCESVEIGGTKNITVKPNANVAGPVEAQTQSFENPTFTLKGVHYVEQSAYSGTDTLLTFADVLTLYQHKYNGSNQVVLNVRYGETDLASLSGTDIPVVMKNFNLPLSSRSTKGAYLPVGSITFIETE